MTRRTPRAARRSAQPKQDCSSSVPSEGEEIEILFELSPGRTAWWPTTVEEIRRNGEHDRDDCTAATVVYHAGHGQLQQSAAVKFMPGKRLLAQTLEWRECTWRLPDEDTTAPSERGTRTGDVTTETCSIEETVKKTGTRAPQHEPARKKLRSESVSDGVRTDESVRRAASSSEPTYGMGDISARIKFETERVRVELDEKYAAAFRWALFDEIVRYAGTLPRPALHVNDGRFVNYLSRGCVEHTLKTQYPVFRTLLADIQTRFIDKSAPVVIRPDEMASSAAVRVECHVIFYTVRDFFEWVGITPDMNRRAFLIDDRRKVRAGATQAVRLMGSMQTPGSDDDGPIRIFLGQSSGGQRASSADDAEHPTAAGNMEGPLGRCISYESSETDSGVATFKTDPSCTTTRTGVPTDEELYSTFSVSWNACPPAHLRHFAVAPSYTDGVQLGYVTVRYPYVLVRGRATCDPIRELISPELVREVLS